MQFNENVSNRESVTPRVVLRNEPKFSEHEVDQPFNEMKKDLVPYIQEFVVTHDLFKDEIEVGITFAHKGVSSLIAIIDTPTNTLVLKIHRNKELSAGEGQFLMAWEEVGVTVPHVLETGEINGLPYTIMNFIDAPTLDVACTQDELLDKEMFKEMGRTLRLMHSISAEGYGSVIDDRPEFKTVDDWLTGEDMKMRFEYIREHELLKGVEDMLEEAIKTIKTHAESNNSTFCHADFCPANMFATSPITIFDCRAKFNSGYYDLGLIQFQYIAAQNTDEAFEQLLSGYFHDGECNKEVLTAYTLLAFCMKCRYWNQTGRKELLEQARQYFADNR